MNRKILVRLFALMAAIACALGASAAEAYANYTSSNKTLTFYYDDLRSSREGKTYDMNTGSNSPGWRTDSTYMSVIKVVFDSSFAGARPTSTRSWFANMKNLTSITGISYLNTGNVTNMAYMFYNCSALTSNSLDVSNFNTVEVTDMSYMFRGCTLLASLNMSVFNTAKVTNMQHMFRDCKSLKSLDLSAFNTSSVTNMSNMFYGCTSLTTIYAGDGWNTEDVTSSSGMFSNCTRLVGGMGTTYNANHVTVSYAHIDGGPDNPGYFTGINAALEPEAYACYTPWNTTLTFYCDNQRSSRTGNTYSLNTGDNDPDWHTSNGPYASVTQVVFDPSFASARPTSTFNWFCQMQKLQSITGMKEYLNTSEVTNMIGMFGACELLTSLDLSNFNTANVTSMYWMFCGCWSLTSLDLSRFDTSNVTDMKYMFLMCSSLTSLDLSNFITTNVTDMEEMFLYCNNLTTIYVGNGWSTAAVEYSDNMFGDCTSLVGGMGTTYDANHVDKTYAHIDGGLSNPGYLTEKVDFVLGDVNGDVDVNITDVIRLINYLSSGTSTGLNLAAGDVNGDTLVNISDVIRIINYLSNGHW